MKEGQALVALDQQWHIWCFKCGSCGTVLHGEYMGRDGVPYCERDYQKQFGVKCAYCNRFISGKVLQVNKGDPLSEIMPNSEMDKTLYIMMNVVLFCVGINMNCQNKVKDYYFRSICMNEQRKNISYKLVLSVFYFYLSQAISI